MCGHVLHPSLNQVIMWYVALEKFIDGIPIIPTMIPDPRENFNISSKPVTILNPRPINKKLHYL